MLKVYKFGGASVKNAEGIRNVANIVRAADSDLVIVVSAMGKTTNALERVVNATYEGNISIAISELNGIRDYHFQIVNDLYPCGHTFLCNKVEMYLQEILSIVNTYTSKLNSNVSQGSDNDSYDALYDSVVAYGELISTRIVSIFLDREGLSNSCIDMTRILMTDATYRDAKVDMVASKPLLESACNKGEHIYVAQGFIGGTLSGHKTTLGREGSDYTAAIIANLLNAESVTIWKDVPGILNADPRLVENTTLIPELTYYDAVELAYSGAQIIHPKTIRPLENKHIPLYVKPFGNHFASGSVIKGETEKPIDVPVYIWRQNQVLITLRPLDFAFVLEESLSKIFEVVNRNRLKVSLIQSSAVTISVCVDNTRYVTNALEELRKDYKVTFNDNLSLLTIRGTNPEIIAHEQEGRDVLLSQLTRRTAKFVIKNNI